MTLINTVIHTSWLMITTLVAPDYYNALSNNYVYSKKYPINIYSELQEWTISFWHIQDWNSTGSATILTTNNIVKIYYYNDQY
jgi:hypothetical protein